ncbi:ferric-dicitrate binding protein FerR, regulates iron transport through sigma-19 [Chitinophaga eiseniae]|uniref:Ferric-dicitrate binding protein FerR, regulates iron transport through sigma-19 n=1 Tax=Chitinophaga eiseniae TaxID=634771 RepID=A0A1T4PUZ7_9BACT|nr:FecR domain-containing protein [Chitinophaga eiseniae]SJZ95176.1 ferric-dicitrate binding protein FerR, regulates iron transport through sigma-19 [Chitinophaga eiseniae]
MRQLPVDQTLIELYIHGRCTATQLAEVRQYLHDPAYRESLQEWLHHDWQQLSHENYAPETDADEKYRQYLALVQPAPATPVKQISTIRWWKVAVAAVFTGIIALTGWRWQQHLRQRAFQEQQWVQLHNEAGKRTKITLPDSSQVYLDAVSSLQYNKNYGVTNRNIILEGEAYFVVKHGGAHPFSVQTGNLTTIDVGTAFNIRYRHTEPAIEVAVAEGIVNVMDHARPQTGVLARLTQQQQLHFDTATREATVQMLPDAESIGAWRHGVLIFRQQPLKAVAAALERYYGINIRFDSPEAARGVITTILHHSTVDEALDIVAITAGVSVKRSGKEVLIK